jgi:FtsP/CotA-like multicopper oxidase with cupredoxin domain
MSRGGVLWLFAAALALAGTADLARAQSSDPADQICPRFAPGSVLPAPPDLRSQNGVLELTLLFKTTVDQQGLTRYCYVTDTGLESPTLHVMPGDQLIIHFQNTLAAGTAAPPQSVARLHGHAASDGPNDDCAGGAMGPMTTNLHFHGLNVAPTCHQDEVITTLVQPSESFDYTVQIPTDEPTGLYWYHPHPHGFSTGQVLGGAAGALIVDGIENVNPIVANLTQRVFVLRDQSLPPPAGGAPPSPPAGQQAPGLDLSVNFVPVTAPAYTTPVVQTAAAASEFWRVLNAAANTQMQLQYVVGGVAQPLQLVALDGVPIGQGTGSIQTVTQTSIVLAPGARAEFIAVTPTAGQQGQLLTQAINTGAGGLPTPARPLASIVPQAATPAAAARLGAVRTAVRMTRFANLNVAAAASRRLLYFSESVSAPGAAYYITVQGQTPVAYVMGAPPSIVLHQGATEEWIVENRALEDHIFHIHQTRFQTLAINGQSVSDPALRDTITVPHWSGSGPYPSVKLLMDFRPANIVGTFVYHCHILSHEDLGMMAAIQVLPNGIATTTTLTASVSEATLNSPVDLSAVIAPASAGAALTGTVQFFDGDAALGNAVAVQNGRAVLTAQLSAYGSHLISAAYSGDATRNQSLAAGIPVTVEDFALSAPSLTIKQGQSGSVPVQVTTSPGFSSVMDFSCALPASATGATCEITPASLAAAGTITLTVKTRAALAAAKVSSLTAVLAALVMLAVPYRRRRRLMLAAGLLGALTLLGSCGGSSAPPDTATPTGTYTLSLKASCAGDASPITHVVSVQFKIT